MQRRRPAFATLAAGVPDDRPISELNTTPLIDVMLVLLIMFIVTIPIANHAVKLDLPVGPPPAVQAEPTVHRLDIDAGGRLFWDGAPVAEAALPARLETVRAAGPDAVLHLRADAEARYETFDRILAAVKRAGVERLGFPDNQVHAAAIAR
ncbi:MAG: ExbD/TolR family protein [Allosphingosinicella sp.]